MGDKESRANDAKLDSLIESGKVCSGCGCNNKKPYTKQPTLCNDCYEDYDPTPCCYQHGVGAIGTNEKCPDIADND